MNQLIDSWSNNGVKKTGRENSDDMFVPQETLNPRSVKNWLMMCTDLPRRIRDRNNNPTDSQELRREMIEAGLIKSKLDI